MLTDVLFVGDTEIANSARLRAYLSNVGSPLESGPDVCACESLTAEVLGDNEYTVPEDPDEPAPWFDPDVPESADFLGLLVLDIEGIDDHPVVRTVTTAVTGGGALGPARVQPRQMVFRALLLGLTCCSVQYGLHWLAQALQGCSGASCGGDCVTLFECCPEEDMDPDTFNARYRRTFRRVALTDGPRVTGRDGDGSCARGACGGGSEIITVEWTLTAATPWAFGDEMPLLDVEVPTDDGAECVDWCVHDSSDPDADCGTCRLAQCAADDDACSDPECSTPSPPVPTSPGTCFCHALAVNEECYEIDLSGRPMWYDDVPLITVYSGSEDLRRLTITLYERPGNALTCEQAAEQRRCEPFAEWTVDYVPAGAAVFLDGQTGRAILDCGGQCTSATSVYGRDGAPPTWPAMSCASFCICLASDAFVPPAPDARVTFGVSGRVG